MVWSKNNRADKRKDVVFLLFKMIQSYADSIAEAERESWVKSLLPVVNLEIVGTSNYGCSYRNGIL